MKLKNVLFIAIAILTIGLFVACNDDVVVAAKDNNVAYTQVLESNGAFEYNGTKYETLQDAIEAIDKAKAYPSKTIKVLKDVNSDGATVPATAEYIIILDLNGKTLSFLSANGITVDGGLYVTGDGEFAFSEGVTDGTAITVSGTGAFYVEDAKFNVPGQNAVKATGGTVNLGNNTTVDGNIEATGTSRVNLGSGSKFVANGSVTIGTGATFDVETESNPTVALKLNGGTLAVDKTMALNEDSVLTSGNIVLPEGSIDSHITKPESVEIPSTVNISTGLYSITRGTVTTYYNTLQHAMDAYDNADYIIVQLFKDGAAASVLTTGPNTVKLQTKADTTTEGADIGALIVPADKTLVISGNGVVTSVALGQVTDEVTTYYGKLIVDGTYSAKPTISTVIGSGIVESQNAVFSGSVACTTLTDGSNTDGSTTVYANGSIFEGAVTATGDIELFDSTIQPSLTEVDYDFVRSEGSITMGGVKFKNQYVGVCAAKGESVNMTNSTGEVYKIVATSDGSTTPGKITIDNSMTSSTFTIINEVAARVGEYSSVQYNDVTIIGHAAESVLVDVIDAAGITISYARVTSNAGQAGARANTGDFKSDNSVFDSIVEVHGSITDGTNEETHSGSEFKGTVRAKGALRFYGATFTSSPTITSTNGGNITIKKSTGTTGAITTQAPTGATAAPTACGTITIDNSALAADAASLTTGSLSATYFYDPTEEAGGDVTVYGDVTVTGKAKANLIVAAVTGNDFTVTKATVTGAVQAYNNTGDTGDVVSNGSEFQNTVTAEGSITDGTNASTASGSTFNGSVTTSGDGKFYGSTFKPADETEENLDLKAATLVIDGTTFEGTEYQPEEPESAYTVYYDVETSGADIESVSSLTIRSSKGEMGTLEATGGSISVDNSGISDTGSNLSTGAITAKNSSDTYYDVRITAPNVSNSTISVTGKITGKEITMRAGNSCADNGSLVVNGVAYEEFYATTSINLYGGTYGFGESVLFSGDGTIYIHAGTFYVSSSDGLASVAENIYGSSSLTSLPVNIYINDNITLETDITIGNHGSILDKAKLIVFNSTYPTTENENNYEYILFDDYYSDTHHNHIIDVYSGTVKFMTVNLIGNPDDTDIMIMKYRTGYADIYNAPSTTRQGTVTSY